MKKNNKGFTLAELLIVVAIIAVLTAIAIPVFTSQLEKSKEATDISNIRSYYAEVTTALLTGDLKNQNDKIIVGNSMPATLQNNIIGMTSGDTFTVTVSGVKFQQGQASWQTKDFDIAGVHGSAGGGNVGQWSGTTTSNITYHFVVAEDGDYTLNSIALR